MKNILLVLLCFPFMALAQSPGENYIKTKIYKRESTNTALPITASDTIVKIDYQDGLGRPMQSITLGGGGTGKDIVKPIVYNSLGQKTIDCLPYVNKDQTVSSPNYTDSEMLIHFDLTSYYGSKFASDFISTTNPYSQVRKEDSPLGRIIEQAAPGADWALSGSHTVKYEYNSNKSVGSTGLMILGVVYDNVYDFNITFTDNDTAVPVLAINGLYGSGKLYKTVTKNENWTSTDGDNKTTQEFKDLNGRLILKRAFESGLKYDTYYVYDRFGNLTFTIPPKALDAIVLITTTGRLGAYLTTYSIVQSAIPLCYQYHYDYRNRLIEAFTPDKGWVYTVFDKLNRPVLTQDANQAIPDPVTLLKKWSFIKYDTFDRVAYTGELTTTSDRVTLQNNVNSSSTVSETRTSTAFTNGGATINYTYTAIPNTSINVLAVNYYDTYDNFVKAGIIVPTITTHGNTLTTAVKGLTTGGLVKVVDGTTTNWVTTVNGYDAKARLIWSKNNNAYYSTTNTLQLQLNFEGSITNTTSLHQRSGFDDVKVVDAYSFDKFSRPLIHTQQINDGNNINLISWKQYDELGQFTQEKVGGVYTTVSGPNLFKTFGTMPAWQTVDYSYNVRGWLKGINNTAQDLSLAANTDLFNFKINYNTTDNSGSTALFNGNIAETVWKSKADNKLRNYSYQYDGLNRLTNANYIGNYTLTNFPTQYEKYKEGGITYDKNGNILTLLREGLKSNNTTGTIDNLTYTYTANSNRLLAVSDTDTGIDPTLDGFINKASVATEYTYDANGNMTSDANKGITAITYNSLNLPLRITFGANKYIDYVYDGQGTKVKKTVTNGTAVTVTQFLGGFIYQSLNGAAATLQYFGTEKGYVSKSSTAFNYVFQYTDHLGNVRTSYTKDASGNLAIVEENNYYAFGLKHNGYNVNGPLGNAVAQKYKYNGKELENDLALNVYGMDWRQYDPALGRFNTVDKLAELTYSMSPYTFGNNNPILFSDPSGLQGKPTNYAVDWKGRDKFDKFGNYISPDARGPERQFNMFDYLGGGNGYGGIGQGANNISGGDLKGYFRDPFTNSLYGYVQYSEAVPSELKGAYEDTGFEFSLEKIFISNPTAFDVGNGLFGTFLTGLEKASEHNSNYIYRYASQGLSAAALTEANALRMLKIAKKASILGNTVGLITGSYTLYGAAQEYNTTGNINYQAIADGAISVVGSVAGLLILGGATGAALPIIATVATVYGIYTVGRDIISYSINND